MLTWRGLIASLSIVFGVVVSGSFAYGALLLFRSQGGEGAAGTERLERRSVDVKALLARGREHVAKGEIEQAILCYRHVLGSTPSVEAQFGLAEGERLAGRDDVAADEYERVLRIEPGHAPALSNLAALYAARRDTWEQAIDRYRRYVQVEPGDAPARLALARLLAWTGKASDAVGLYAQPGVQALLTARDRRDYALTLLEAGRPAEAEPLLAALAAEAPQDLDLQRARAGLHAARQEWAVALPIYRGLLQQRPDDAQANLTLGQGLMAQDSPAEAVAPLGRAVALLPANAEARLAYARALRATGHLEEADRQFARVMALTGGEPEAAREYAELLMQRRSHGRAEKWYRRALAGGIRDTRLLLGLGGALSARGKPREAVPFLEEAYQLQPSDQLALDLVRLYRRAGQNERALQLLARLEHAGGAP